MLPASSTHRLSLADVLPDCLAALDGRQGPLGLAPVEHAIVALVDGLGTAALARRSGHARTLSAASSRGAIGVGFPTTTAAAIATFATGERPGRHGLVGYSVLDAARDRVVNQLSGWDAGMPPETWQRVPTVFERARDAGIRAAAVGPVRYRDSGFSRAVLRGAEYLPAQSMAERFARAASVTRQPGRSLTYVYVPELDAIAHRRGVESPEWTAALEELDAAVADLPGRLGRGAGALLTADHGVVDVPHDAHVILDADDLAGVRHVAGEPRALQLHLEPGGVPGDVAERLGSMLGRLAWVATRAEAVEAGWFGEVDPDVLPRIGDVLVVARRPVAFYASDVDPGRGMVGQHGALSPEETGVPLLRFGAFA